MELEVFVLAGSQLHSANHMVGGSITHSSVAIVPTESLEVSIGPREELCVVLDRLEEGSEDQDRVLLLLGREAIKRIERIGGNDLGKLEFGLLAVTYGKVKSHDAWNGLLSMIVAIVVTISRPRCVVPHDMRTDTTALSFSSTIIRA